MELEDYLRSYEEDAIEYPPSWIEDEYDNPAFPNTIVEGEDFDDYKNRKAKETTLLIRDVLLNKKSIYRVMETDCDALKYTLRNGLEWEKNGVMGVGIYWSVNPLVNFSKGINCLLKAHIESLIDPVAFTKESLDIEGTYINNLADFIGNSTEREFRFNEGTDGKIIVDEVCDVKDTTPEITKMSDKRMKIENCEKINALSFIDKIIN